MQTLRISKTTRKLLSLFVLLFCSFVVFSQVQTQKQLLTDSERRGKEIYLRGTSPSGREITARISEIDVPASTLACGGCHGLRGEGKTEGGVTAGNLTWSNLIKPYGHTHTTGRKHGAFTESALIRAVVNGVDPDGNELLVAMPRYRLSPEDMADLIAYIKRIDTDLDPGLTDTNITVGAVVPSSGALADTGAAMKDVLTAYFDNINSRGGIFSRKIDLRVADSGIGGATTAGAAQNFTRKEQVFAFVSGLSAGSDQQIATLTRTEEIPFIGPSTLLPHLENPANKYLFYLLPGISEQAMALVNFAALRPEIKKATSALVYGDATLSNAAGNAAAEQAQKSQLPIAKKIVFKSAGFDPQSIVKELKTSNVEYLFFFGDTKEQTSLLNEAAAAGWSPNLLLIGTLSGTDMSSILRPGSSNQVFLAFPTVPSDISNEAGAEFRALQEKYKFPARHLAAQLSAFAAAKVLVEGLTRAGRDLSREKLINSLDSLYEYETGVTPRLTFGPNRRVGAAGAHIITFDPTKKELTSLGWFNAY